MNRRRRSHGSSTRDYPRTARVNELLREIIGDELERIDDPRLEWVSITGVEVNPELTSAMVFYSALDGADADPIVLEALAERRVRLQSSIARQARLRRTPELHFGPDRGVREGIRVEELLRDLGPLPGGDDEREGSEGAVDIAAAVDDDLADHDDPSDRDDVADDGVDVDVAPGRTADGRTVLT